MSNRYNVYKDVDYVHQPIDAYATAAIAAEQGNLASLAASKEAYDNYKALQASARPDREIKDEITTKIGSDIQALAGKNLKGSDVLLNINKIINNPDYISGLAGVQQNALDRAERLKGDKAYLDLTGNNINTIRNEDDYNDYNSQGKEAFRAGALKGNDPGKFLNIEEDLGKSLEKGAKEGYTRDSTDGRWKTTADHLGLTSGELAKKMSPKLNDPAYAKQLEHLDYYELRKYGNPNNRPEAIANYNKLHVDHLDKKIGEANTTLADMIARRKKLTGKAALGMDSDIEEGRKLIKSFTAERGQYASDTKGEKFSTDMLTNLLEGGVAQFVREPDITREEDKYGLIWANSAATEGREGRLAKLKASLLKKVLQTDEKEYPIEQFADASSYKSGIAQEFDKDFKDLKIVPSSLVSPGGKYGNLSYGYSGNAFNVTAPNANKDGTPKPVNPKTLEFGKFVKDKLGYPVDMNEIALNGTTEKSKTEFIKLAKIHSNIANGSINIPVTGYDISLAAAPFDPEKTSQYIMGAVRGANGVIMNEDTHKQVSFSEVFGSGDKAAAMAAALLNNQMSGNLSLRQNKVKFTGLDGKGNYSVHPGRLAGEGIQDIGDILNPSGNTGTSNKLGLSSIGNWTTGKDGLPDGGFNRDIFVNITDNSGRPIRLNDQEANEIVKARFKSNDNPKMEERLKKDGAVIITRVPGQQGVGIMDYHEYMADREAINQKLRLDDNSDIMIFKKDPNGVINILRPGIVNEEYKSPEGKVYMHQRKMTGADIATKEVNKLLEGVLGGYIKGPDKNTMTLQDKLGFLK